MPRLLPLVLALVLLGGAQLAHADAVAPTVTIAPSGGGAARTLTLADLAGDFDVHGATYTVRAADGTERTVTVADGISLNALLAAAGLDADAFTYLGVARGDGSSTIVLRDDLGGTEQGPPVVWSDEQGVHVLRPSRGDGDANAGDLVTVPGGALAIALETGEPLVPRIQVSTLRPRPRERVDFGASLAAGELDAGMEFSWYFDGPVAHGSQVSHRFGRPGMYLVLLSVVRGSGETVGATETVRIHVVAPPRERHRRDARRSDASQGAADDGGSGAGTGSGSGGGATGAGTSAPAPPTATPTAVPAAAAPHRAPAPRRPPPGELVSGTLLATASAAATPAQAPAAGRAAAAAARGAASNGPLHVPVGVWVAIGLAVLLALGWALESRHTLPFWQP